MIKEALRTMLFGGFVLLFAAQSSTAGQVKWKLAAPAVRAETVDVVADELVADARRATEPLTRFERLLVAANWMLSYQLEPMATRMLLRTAEQEDADRAREVIDRATELLVSAAEVWSQLESADVVDGYEHFVRGEQLESISAFCRAFAVIWPARPLAGDDREEQLRMAASKLGVVLESDRPNVVALATLWQSYLFHERGEIDRCLDLLPPVLRPFDGQEVDGLWLRIMRCRYLAQAQGQYTAAIASLIRADTQCDIWFSQEAMRVRARNVISLVRRQILMQWAAQGGESAADEGVTWCMEAVDRIDEQFQDREIELLRLRGAAPAIVDLGAAIKLSAGGVPIIQAYDKPADVEPVGDQ